MLAKEITSLQHPIVKRCVKLRQEKKAREGEKLVLIAGKKQVQEAKTLELLLVEKGYRSEIQAMERYEVSRAILKKVTGLETPEPIAALVPLPEESPLKGMTRVIALDGVADPGNLGTLFRTALALGWEGVFLTTGCCDPFNDKALRAAKGATFRLPYKTGTADDLLTLAKKEQWQGVVADMGGEPLATFQPEEKILVVLGNEASGASSVLKKAYSSLSIPICGIESLNVGAAGAIILYTLRR